MALSNRINFRGGQNSLGKYLYKDGVDNVALTGGLSESGYSYHSSYVNGGTVTFEPTDINIAVTAQGSRYKMVGTTLQVNFTNKNSVIMKYTVNGTQNVITLDVSQVTGYKYISFYIYFVNSSNHVGIIVASSKANMVQEPDCVRSELVVGASSFKINEIQYT